MSGKLAKRPSCDHCKSKPAQWLVKIELGVPGMGRAEAVRPVRRPVG